MKRFLSLLLILSLVLSVFTLASLPAFAEGEDMGEENTETDAEGGSAGEENTEGGNSDDLPEDAPEDTPDNDTEEPPVEGSGDDMLSADPVWAFLASIIPVDDLTRLKDALWGFVVDVWDFILNDETYTNILTAILAVLALLVIPFIIGAVVVVYVAIGAMVIFAGALTAIIEMIIGMIPAFIF